MATLNQLQPEAEIFSGYLQPSQQSDMFSVRMYNTNIIQMKHLHNSYEMYSQSAQAGRNIGISTGGQKYRNQTFVLTLISYIYRRIHSSAMEMNEV